MTEPAELNFESVRNKAILKIVRDLERKNELQWKNFKILQSEHNVLKRNYLNLIEGHTDIVVGKNKTIRSLREKVKELKETVEELEFDLENYGMGDL